MEVGRHLDRLWRRRVNRTRERTRIGGRLIEDDWFVAPGHLLTSFDAEPRPPFRWQVVEQPAHLLGFSQTGVCDTLDEVMAVFCDEWMPPRVGLAAVVMDESFRIVFGWAMPEWFAAKFGSADWTGTAAGYRWLAGSGRFAETDVEAWRMHAEVAQS
jgi:hypothetical protein